MEKYLIIIVLLFCISTIKSQTTYLINYEYEQIATSCNVFGSTKTIDGYQHQTTLGYPTFDQSGYFVNLPCKSASSSLKLGTEFQILFPF